jgi:2-C-methyl-D-erythritol 4-phosphate cytidylyltransferase / 2-C-methyl-D-erythritol 2,4-cyclodiphosphate synthase
VKEKSKNARRAGLKQPNRRLNPQSAIPNPQSGKSEIRNPQSGKSAIETVAAIVAAGGTGTRMGAGVPKQFLELAGKPILLRTLEGLLLLQDLIEIVVTLPSKYVAAAQELIDRERWRVPVRCVRGGSTRQRSVIRGVAQVNPRAGLILVHDAVRPLCDPEIIRRVVDAARLGGGAVPGLPATETIQRVSGRRRILATPPREQLYAIQTPQCFHAKILRSSLERASKAGYEGTDESSVVRWAGHRVVVVPGDPDNIKITRALDLDLAEILLCGERTPRLRRIVRIGHGIDYHRLADGRKLMLGGVQLPFDKGLEGHSDADVLCHAICDALLGAAGLGDIGQHFPDSDPANRSRSSLEFLTEVQAKLEAGGWAIGNLDTLLLLERPRIAPFIESMRHNIACALGIGTDRLNIKAGTTEGMNAEGRGEGISAQAVAFLEKI